jgi:hypothetical protein
MVSDQHTLVDRDGHASHAYGVTSDALILVRSDGYVGLTGKSLSSQPIVDYFHRIIGS